MDRNTETINLTRIPQHVTEFLDSLSVFEKLVSKYDFKTRTHSEVSLKKFLQMPFEAQNQVIKQFTGFMHFLQDAELEGIDLKDDGALLKKFFAKFNLIYDNGLFNKIRKGDVIEIYTSDYVQIYRNLSFMNLCSYTLLDLLTFDPFELYERSYQLQKDQVAAVSVLATRAFNTEAFSIRHIPQHLIREKFSIEKLTSTVRFKYLFPLYKWPQNFYGLLVLQEGENVKDISPDVTFL